VLWSHTLFWTQDRHSRRRRGEHNSRARQSLRADHARPMHTRSHPRYAYTRARTQRNQATNLPHTTPLPPNKTNDTDKRNAQNSERTRSLRSQFIISEPNRGPTITRGQPKRNLWPRSAGFLLRILPRRLSCSVFAGQVLRHLRICLHIGLYVTHFMQLQLIIRRAL
jgi:hypothetical protein